MDDQAEAFCTGGGRYSVDRRVGEGGGGCVFLAFDQTLQRWVAIKTLKHEDGLIAMNEATQLASLQHQNVVSVYDIFSENGEIFVVMEYVAGWTLDDLPEPMGEGEFREFAAQCLAGIGAAHARGIVHRDIKPSNIMLAETEQGRRVVKILDFGLAKRMPEPKEQSIDQNGALTGSIFTMSPEQLTGGLIDHRTDFYSLGCVFYKVLTLTLPFQGANVPEVVAAHLQHRHVPLAELRPDLPADLVGWVERMFSQEVDGRPLEAFEAEAELAGNAPAMRHQAPVKPERPVWRNPLFAVFVAGVVLSGVVWFYFTLNRSAAPGVSENAGVDSLTVEDQPSEETSQAKLTPRPEVLEGRVRDFKQKSNGVMVLAVEKDNGERIDAVHFSSDAPGEFAMEDFKKLNGARVRISGKSGEFRGQKQVEFQRKGELEVLEPGESEFRETEPETAENLTIEGRVREFLPKGPVVRVLNLELEDGVTMEAVFFADQPQPEFSDVDLQSFKGRRISVTGRANHHKGRDQVVFEKRGDLTVLD